MWGTKRPQRLTSGKASHYSCESYPPQLHTSLSLCMWTKGWERGKQTLCWETCQGRGSLRSPSPSEKVLPEGGTERTWYILMIHEGPPRKTHWRWQLITTYHICTSEGRTRSLSSCPGGHCCSFLLPLTSRLGWQVFRDPSLALTQCLWSWGMSSILGLRNLVLARFLGLLLSWEIPCKCLTLLPCCLLTQVTSARDMTTNPGGIPAPLLDTGARENSLSFCGGVLIVLFCLFVPSFHKEGTLRNWLSLSWCTLLQSSRSPFSSLLQHSKNDGWDRISQQHPWD